jgi:hypothetical protein
LTVAKRPTHGREIEAYKHDRSDVCLVH